MYMKEDQNRPELDIIQTDKPGPRKAAVSTNAHTHAARNSRPPTAPDASVSRSDRPAGNPDAMRPRTRRPANTPDATGTRTRRPTNSPDATDPHSEMPSINPDAMDPRSGKSVDLPDFMGARSEIPGTTDLLNDRPVTDSDNRPTHDDVSPDSPVPRKKKPATQKRPASDEARKKQGSAKNGTRKNSSSKNKNRASTSGTRKKPGATSHSKKSPVRRKKKNAGRRLRTSHFHIAIIALIILVGVVAAIKLIIWNKGVASDYDPNDTSTEFDTEPEDFLIPPDSQTLALQKDDGITSVLLLGNDALASARGESDNIGVYLEEIIGGKVYNASLSNTYLSVKNAVYDESYQNDVFSL